VGEASTVDWRLGLPVLRSDRVLLREPVLSDAPALFRELCVPEVCQYVPPPPPAVDGIQRMIAKGIERRRAGQVFSFGIQPAASDELAGILQFVSSRDHRRPSATPAVWELGFALSARYWGAGLLGEAATMALGFAFRRVGLEAVEAWVIADNRRANRALEKLGGVPVSKPNTQAPDGRTADFVLWTLRDTVV
jgi:ribosomal-protein-alanine N-acetyltransferase